jgi:hypothetical protein
MNFARRKISAAEFIWQKHGSSENDFAIVGSALTVT